MHNCGSKKLFAHYTFDKTRHLLVNFSYAKLEQMHSIFNLIHKNETSNKRA